MSTYFEYQNKLYGEEPVYQMVSKGANLKANQHPCKAVKEWTEIPEVWQTLKMWKLSETPYTRAHAIELYKYIEKQLARINYSCEDRGIPYPPNEPDYTSVISEIRKKVVKDSDVEAEAQKFRNRAYIDLYNFEEAIFKLRKKCNEEVLSINGQTFEERFKEIETKIKKEAERIDAFGKALLDRAPVLQDFQENFMIDWYRYYGYMGCWNEERVW